MLLLYFTHCTCNMRRISCLEEVDAHIRDRLYHMASTGTVYSITLKITHHFAGLSWPISSQPSGNCNEITFLDVRRGHRFIDASIAVCTPLVAKSCHEKFVEGGVTSCVSLRKSDKILDNSCSLQMSVALNTL